jgi:uncharacterized protein (DUF1800 family)
MQRKSSRKAHFGTNKSFSVMIAAFALAGLTFAAPYLLAGKDKNDKSHAASSSNDGNILPIQSLSNDEAILHAFNRLGFGTRPGDLERVKQMGLQKWIDQQLHPESIDDSGVEARLNRFPTLKMSSTKLEKEFPRPQVAAKREGITVEEYRKEQQERARGLVQSDDEQAGAQSDVKGARQDPEANPGQAPAEGKGEKGFNDRMIDYADVRTPQRVVAELAMAKMTRAVYSERQLEEQMVDFWYNHFNVFAGKGADIWLITSYERDAIRPNAMGKFRDLLEATAKSPAMMFYLDNWLSADPVAWARMRAEQQARQQRRFLGPFGGPFGRPGFPPPAPPNAQNAKKQQERGLNENYGRELMELHTLGVDGGYTQDDVIEVAKAFTGWSIRKPQQDPEFFFDDRIHDTSTKMVLGHKIQAGGMKDGEEVLDILARDPHTAHHISYELAQHFVADNPPHALVDRMTQTFEKTDGDIREVLHTMIYSPEFWSKDTYRVKIKTPFELVASVTRAVGAEVNIPLMLVQWTNRIGEPLYQCMPPTGYSTKADAWVNTGALLNRMNFSLALTADRIRGAQVDVSALLGDEAGTNPSKALDRAIQVLLAGQATPETRATLEKQLDDPQILRASLDDPVKQVNSALVAGLVLGSPEFQRR